jgi:hypothetical protein
MAAEKAAFFLPFCRRIHLIPGLSHELMTVCGVSAIDAL